MENSLKENLLQNMTETLTNINSVYGIAPLLDYFKLWKETNYK